MDGEQQARRNASDLLDVKLIYRAALEQRGREWDSDPVAGKPHAVFVSSDGRRTFLFDGFPITGYSLLPGRRLEKITLVGSLVGRRAGPDRRAFVQRARQPGVELRPQPTCLHCGADLRSARRSYCSDAHKLRAFRRRRAGAEQDAFPGGARKSRLKWRGHQRRRELAALLAARPPL